MIKKIEELDEQAIKDMIKEHYTNKDIKVVDIALSCHTDTEYGMASSYVTATVEHK